jgi:hypothetical protein
MLSVERLRRFNTATCSRFVASNVPLQNVLVFTMTMLATTSPADYRTLLQFTLAEYFYSITAQEVVDVNLLEHEHLICLCVLLWLLNVRMPRGLAHVARHFPTSPFFDKVNTYFDGRDKVDFEVLFGSDGDGNFVIQDPDYVDEIISYIQSLIPKDCLTLEEIETAVLSCGMWESAFMFLLRCVLDISHAVHDMCVNRLFVTTPRLLVGCFRNIADYRFVVRNTFLQHYADQADKIEQVEDDLEERNPFWYKGGFRRARFLVQVLILFLLCNANESPHSVRFVRRDGSWFTTLRASMSDVSVYEWLVVNPVATFEELYEKEQFAKYEQRPEVMEPPVPIKEEPKPQEPKPQEPKPQELKPQESLKKSKTFNLDLIMADIAKKRVRYLKFEPYAESVHDTMGAAHNVEITSGDAEFDAQKMICDVNEENQFECKFDDQVTTHRTQITVPEDPIVVAAGLTKRHYDVRFSEKVDNTAFPITFAKVSDEDIVICIAHYCKTV